MMSVRLFLRCQTQIGLQGAIAILNGDPHEIDGWLCFSIYGVSCAWGINSNPVLLQNCDDDQNFQTFEDLLLELLPH
jgi:hypothetical protein